ncbi:MAG TPA: DUF58 domain-containing protein, partial [Gemmataceae bacterium]|nr:DUF58 domain-containing protein [Gemmataceae bacterium]
ESMRYGSGPTRPDGRPVVSKYDYAAMSAAALAYLVLHQQDSAGLVTFDDQVRAVLKPSSQPSLLKQIVNILNVGPGRERTRIGPIFHDMAERVTRRGIVMVFSDLFDEPADVLTGLMHLRHRRHEVIVFHVMDRAEEEFPFQESTLFRGMEQMPELLTDPRSLRDGYLEQVQLFMTELEQGCRAQNIDFIRLRTDRPLGLALSTYLARRLARKGK